MHCCLLLRIGTNSRLAALRTTTFARSTQRLVQVLRGNFQNLNFQFSGSRHDFAFFFETLRPLFLQFHHSTKYSISPFFQNRVSTDRRLILDLDAPSKKATNSNGSSSSQQKKQKKRIEWSAGAVGMLIIPAFAFSLGCWQVMRLQWKIGLLEHLKSRLSQPAQQLPEDLTP